MWRFVLFRQHPQRDIQTNLPAQNRVHNRLQRMYQTQSLRKGPRESKSFMT